MRTTKQRLRRLVRLLALAFSKGYAIPVFESRALNRAITRTEIALRKAKTQRRYSRRMGKLVTAE